MKRIIFGLVIVAVIAVICFVPVNNFINNKDNKVEDNSTNDSDIEEVIVNKIDYDEKELFGNYYSKANDIVNNMSLEEKIGQLFLVRYDKSITNNYINNYNVGGFLLFAKDFQNHTKDSIKSEIDNIQKISKYPLAIAVDEEGGYVTRVSRYENFRESKFLAPKYYYETGGYELLESMENEKATLLKSIGVNLNLAPVADISTDPNDFIYSRSFGYNSTDTSVFIKNMISYSNKNNFSSCLKHFPGYGNNVDTHTGIAIDNREYENFINNDYLPFKSGIDEGVPFILVSHNIVNSIDSNYPASLSFKVISEELRQKLKFSGIVITDDLDMDAVKSYAENGNCATLAINAGADMIITSDYINMYNELIDGVKSNNIDISKIDYAVLRVLAWKMAYNLM